MVTVTTEMPYATARTSVWWDIENCQVPKTWDAHGIAQNIATALVNMNYSGPISISAYGDTNRIPSCVQRALSSTGVALNHVPSGSKDASDKKILVDMLLWAVDNPAPANFMLISGDRDFSNALHQLRMRRYTILLAHPLSASAPLMSAAETVWLWTSMATGGRPIKQGHYSQFVVSDTETSNHPVPGNVSSTPRNRRRIDDGGNKGDELEASTQPVEHQINTKKSQATFCGSQIKASTKVEMGKTKHVHSLSSNVVQTCKCVHGNHKLGRKQGENSTQVSCKPKNKLTGQGECLKEDVGKRKKDVRSCTHATMVKKQAEVQEHMSVRNAASNKSIKECFTGLSSSRCLPLKEARDGAITKPKKASAKGLEGEVEKKKKKMIDGGAEANEIWVCDLCSVVCSNSITFESHLRGRKHAFRAEAQGEVVSIANKEFLEWKEQVIEEYKRGEDRKNAIVTIPHLDSEPPEIEKERELIDATSMEKLEVSEDVKMVETMERSGETEQETNVGNARKDGCCIC